jgi:hypothetical protein
MKWFQALSMEDRVVGGSLGLTLAGVSFGAILAEPRAFGVTALLVLTVLTLSAWLTRSLRLSWLLLFGAVAGLLELWADWLHVTYLGSLVYTDYFGARLLASPWYMPGGWALTVVQFGYLALRGRDRWPTRSVLVALTLVGLLVPPWYEELAARARAWYYPPTGSMLSHTPVWIILTYGGCTFAIGALAVAGYQPRAWGRAILNGVWAGAAFMFFGVFWYAWLGQR